MYDGDYYWLMAQYNQWMNHKVYSLCDAITDTERKKDRGAFFEIDPWNSESPSLRRQGLDGTLHRKSDSQCTYWPNSV